MKLFRLSITQRLWLGLGLLLALFAAAALVSLRATDELDDTLSHLVSDGDARTGAAYEMNINLDGTARGRRLSAEPRTGAARANQGGAGQVRARSR